MKKHFDNRRLSILVLFALSVICFYGVCFSAMAEGDKSLMMATTTSTENTGLLDILKPTFKKATGIELKSIATGTGKALKLGENCDVDVLMVHAPEAEKKYIENGFGMNRRQIMYNDFVIIGPRDDPAGVKRKTVADALKSIAAKKDNFISRGDNSGTHKKELALWTAAGLAIPEKEKWYVQTGQGMLPTILIAEEQSAYTLADRGTYIAYEAGQHESESALLVILVEGESVLLNQYSVIAVNPDKCPNVKIDQAMVFIEWITGKEAQNLIGEFRLKGKQLFTPNAKD